MKVTQSCPTLCDPMDSTVHGILQARKLDWVAFPFSRGSSQPRDRTQVSHIAGEIPYQLSHKGSRGERREVTVIVVLKFIDGLLHNGPELSALHAIDRCNPHNLGGP